MKCLNIRLWVERVLPSRWRPLDTGDVCRVMTCRRISWRHFLVLLATHFRVRRERCWRNCTCRQWATLFYLLNSKKKRPIQRNFFYQQSKCWTQTWVRLTFQSIGLCSPVSNSADMAIPTKSRLTPYQDTTKYDKIRQGEMSAVQGANWAMLKIHFDRNHMTYCKRSLFSLSGNVGFDFRTSYPMN